MSNGNGGGIWSQFWQTLSIPKILLGMLVLAVVAGLAVGIYSGGGKFLNSLQEPAVARGLITFLIAFTTVAIALILALYAIIGSSGDDLKDRFGFAKEILTALIGILGTILGFYFGSSTQPVMKEFARPELNQSSALQIAPAFISNQNPKKSETVVISSFVSGGTPPYIYSIWFSPPDIAQTPERTSIDGVIREEITIPDSVQTGTKVACQVVTRDSNGKSPTGDVNTTRCLITVAE